MNNDDNIYKDLDTELLSILNKKPSDTELLISYQRMNKSIKIVSDLMELYTMATLNAVNLNNTKFKDKKPYDYWNGNSDIGIFGICMTENKNYKKFIEYYNKNFNNDACTSGECKAEKVIIFHHPLNNIEKINNKNVKYYSIDMLYMISKYNSVIKTKINYTLKLTNYGYNYYKLSPEYFVEHINNNTKILLKLFDKYEITNPFIDTFPMYLSYKGISSFIDIKLNFSNKNDLLTLYNISKNILSIYNDNIKNSINCDFVKIDKGLKFNMDLTIIFILISHISSLCDDKISKINNAVNNYVKLES